ncbi:hypothetical protein V6N13_123146 [Hibiscus sabdariffa]|uniref:Uncharacterized protein n=1 Tax=Hibiscus sabdariffa TaxID=183260 RepID=A0ABR2CXR5_9ROSI
MTPPLFFDLLLTPVGHRVGRTTRFVTRVWRLAIRLVQPDLGVRPDQASPLLGHSTRPMSAIPAHHPPSLVERKE